MTHTPGEPVTRPTPTSVAAPAPFEDVTAVEKPGRPLPAVLGSRPSLAGLAALAAGAAVAALLVVRRRADAHRRLPLR